MPESVKDRLTRSHETILMLAKTDSYYWDSEAAREPATSKDAGADGKRNMRNVWTIALQPFRGAHFAPFPKNLYVAAFRWRANREIWCLTLSAEAEPGKVAMELGRRSVLLDINYTGDKGGYDELARQRFQKALGGVSALE